MKKYIIYICIALIMSLETCPLWAENHGNYSEKSTIDSSANSNTLISQVGVDFHPILPQILELMRQNSISISEPLRELQQAFITSSIPNIENLDIEKESITSLLSTINEQDLSPDLKRFLVSILESRLTTTNNSRFPISSKGSLSRKDLEKLTQKLSAATKNEALKWLPLFKQELDKLRNTKINLSK